jgi:translation elongation factor EF-G
LDYSKTYIKYLKNININFSKKEKEFKEPFSKYNDNSRSRSLSEENEKNDDENIREQPTSGK